MFGLLIQSQPMPPPVLNAYSGRLGVSYLREAVLQKAALQKAALAYGFVSPRGKVYARLIFYLYRFYTADDFNAVHPACTCQHVSRQRGHSLLRLVYNALIGWEINGVDSCICGHVYASMSETAN